MPWDEEWVRVSTHLDDLVEEWHNSVPIDDGRYVPLHQHLGMTWEEYSEWVSHGKIPDRYFED